jgi:hypothetical protein
MSDAAGKVRVYVRCRPLLGKEIINQKFQKCVNFDNTDKRKIVVGNGKEFVFDHIYDDESKQDEIYVDCVKSLVEGIVFISLAGSIYIFVRMLSWVQCNSPGNNFPNIFIIYTSKGCSINDRLMVKLDLVCT